MDRTETLVELAATKERIGAWTPASFDVDEWLASEARKLSSMSDPELLEARDKALARIQKREREQKLDALIREAAAQRWEGMVAHRGELTQALLKQLPGELLAAIERMKKQIAARQEYGVAEFSFSQIPGSTMHRSSKGRTEADERATQRARQALEKLEALALVPDDQVSTGITAVLKWLADADAADLPAVKQITRPAPVAALVDAAGVYAEIEPDRPAPRERLSPVG